MAARARRCRGAALQLRAGCFYAAGKRTVAMGATERVTGWRWEQQRGLVVRKLAKEK
jgi:hypothetical protein